MSDYPEHNELTIPYLRKAVEWVEWQEPLPEIDREWYQNSYHTTNVGYAVAMLCSEPGVSVIPPIETIEQVAAHCGTVHCVAGYIGRELDPRYATATTVDGVHVSDFVREALGLTEDDADLLFDYSNDAAAVRSYAEHIVGQPL